MTILAWQRERTAILVENRSRFVIAGAWCKREGADMSEILELVLEFVINLVVCAGGNGRCLAGRFHLGWLAGPFAPPAFLVRCNCLAGRGDLVGSSLNQGKIQFIRTGDRP